MVSPFSIQCFNKLETYAEKMRAALTRPLPAIRDFYDLSYALHHKIICFDDLNFIELVKSKLLVPGVALVDLSEDKYNFLEGKIKTELLPTLKGGPHDFSLGEIFTLLKTRAGDFVA